MGTRLYPMTKDRAKLEKLAKVPAGTFDRLDAMKARHAEELSPFEGMHPADRNEIEYRQWCEIKDDNDLGTLDHFLLYGWGKFHGTGIAEGYAGSIPLVSEEAKWNIWKLFMINSIMGVSIADTEGVCWS